MTMSVLLAVGLLLAVSAWPAATEYELVAKTTVCGMALMAALHASRTSRSESVLGLARPRTHRIGARSPSVGVAKATP